MFVLIAAVIAVAMSIYSYVQMRKMQKKNQPKPSQLDGTIADEGVSFRDIAGSPHIHPNITEIWDRSTSAIKQKSGGFLGIGSSSTVTGYRYYANFAAFIGNRIEKFLAINFDNRGWIVHDITKHPFNMLPINAPSLFGQDEGGVAGNIDLEFGYPDPQQNATYKQHFDLVSAYPYESYLVFRGLGEVEGGGGLAGGIIGSMFPQYNSSFYLGNSNYMKEMLLWVKRTRVRNDGRGQWYEVRGDGAVVCEIGNFKVAYSSIKKADIPNFIYQFEASPTANHTYSSGVGIKWIFGSTSYGGVENPTISDTISTKPIGAVELSLFDLVEININVLFETRTADISFENAEVLHIDRTEKEDADGTKSIQIKAICRPYGGFPYVVATGTGTIYKNNTNAFNFRVGFVALAVDEARYTDESGGVDINPIHKIREILTDDTAMSKPESDVNNVNFMKAADRIYDEGLGISWAIDEKSCIEAIEELCYHIEAGIRVNRQTGLYEMVLFRDDWFAEDEIHNISESRIKDLSLEVMNSDDIVNQLNVTYYDRERIKNSTFSVYENGSILTMGKANAESIDFPYFMNMRNAEIVANWKLKQYSTPAWKGTLTTGWREARKWNRYDLVKINWSKKWQGTILARIMKIDLGNGLNNEVMIDFEEVVPYSGEMNTSIVVDDSAEEKAEPAKPAIGETFEAPYYIAVQNIGQRKIDEELAHNPDVGFTFSTYRRPQWNALYTEITTINADAPENGWVIDGNAEFVTSGQFDQVVSRTATQIVVKNINIEGLFGSGDLIVAGTWLAGVNGLYEFMIVESFDSETNILTVKRGALDTIPTQWDINGWFFVSNADDGLFSLTEYSAGDNVRASSLTVTPSSKLEHVGSSFVSMRSRAIRPYPPANVKINGEYWPETFSRDLVLTWVDRNRLQQTGGQILGWYDEGVTKESGTTYRIQVIGMKVEIGDQSLFDGNIGSVNNYTFPTAGLDYDQYRVVIFSERDGFESLNRFDHVVLTALAAPTNLTATYVA